jgi:polar amino acid transport system substrate-binding protein
MTQHTKARLVAAGATLALSLTALPARAQQAPDPRVADIAQAGVLRFGWPTNSILATKDPTTGEPRGIVVDLAGALGERIGVPVQPVEFANPPQLLEGLRTGAADVGFVAIDPQRARVVDFTPPYMEVDLTYLVPENSSIRTVADADRCGVRIGVARGFQEDNVLTGSLRSATLVRAESLAAVPDLLRDGQVDAVAAARGILLGWAAQIPGSRVLEDRYFANMHAMAIPQGMPGRLAYVSEFIEQAKASGLVQQSIERHAIVGVQVAPPAAQSAEQQIRALFERFVLAQNAHNLAALAEEFLDSPRFLSIHEGTAVVGREAALKQFESLFQGTWRLELRPEEVQVTLLQEGVAKLFAPATLTVGMPAQEARTSRILLNQVLVKGAKGWQIESLLLIPARDP